MGGRKSSTLKVTSTSYIHFVLRFQGKSPFGRLKRRNKDKVKMDLTEIGCKQVERIQLLL